MALLSSNAFRVRLLWILLILVLVDQGRFTYDLVERYRHTDQYARQPFFFGPNPPVVTSVYAEAKDAGLSKEDRFASINGKPIIGQITMQQALLASKPGDALTVRKTDGQELTIRLKPVDRDVDFKLNTVLQFTVVPLCLLLGFTVAFLRPADTRSLILLGLMLSFVSIFRFFEFPTSSWFLRQLTLLLKGFANSTWPFWMVLLGLYFPEKLEARKLTKVLACLLSIPVLLQSVMETLVTYGNIENLPVASAVYPAFHATDKIFYYCGLGAVGLYFACIGSRFATAKTPDARRRVVLLNVGSHVAFLPTLAFIIRSIATGKTMFQGMPPVVAVLALSAMGLFPLTLAYLIVVHRALDIRMVIRSGLQYALAQRAVLVMQVVGITFAIFYAMRLADASQSAPSRILLLGGALVFAVLLRRVASTAKQWMDRKFFREAYDSEKILSELSDQVRTIVETRPLLETVSRRIAESLQVSQVAMLIRNGSAYEPAFALGYATPPQTRFPLDAPIPSRLKQSGQPQTLYLDDPQSWVNRELPDHEDLARLHALHAQVLLPLNTRDELVGFISLGPKRSEEPYTRSDLRLLNSVATQSGLALENTRLTAAIASEAVQRESVNREMQIARDVQMRLFPQKTPCIGGIEFAGACRPAQSVGGDYYDFLELPTGELAFAVGDVSGKGVPAAILMAVLQTSIRAQAMAGTADLAIMTHNVNRLVEEASAKSHFATLFYAQYHPQTRQLRYINAGHNPPLLFHNDGTCETLRPTGLAVGWYRKAVFQEAAIRLRPGDTLIAFTDGFTEAMNGMREEYGDDRFLESIRSSHHLEPSALIPVLMQAVDQFTGEAQQHDDMTIVVLRVNIL